VCYCIKTYTRLLKVNHDDTEEWMNQDKKLLTDYVIVALVSHVGDDHLDGKEKDSKREIQADRERKFTECYTTGLKAMETALAYGEQRVMCYR